MKIWRSTSENKGEINSNGHYVSNTELEGLKWLGRRVKTEESIMSLCKLKGATIIATPEVTSII